MKRTAFIGLIIFVALTFSSCYNTENAQLTAEQLELQKKELELKAKELELREKALEQGTNADANTTNSATTEASFLGKWSFKNGADLMEIKSQNGSFLVIWSSVADGHQPHEIPCALVDGNLVGDFYGHKKNVKIALVDASKISLTINPFAAFEPIRDQVFLKA